MQTGKLFQLTRYSNSSFKLKSLHTILSIRLKCLINSENLILTTLPEYISAKVIKNGKMIKDNLNCMLLDVKWLQKQAQNQGFKIQTKLLGAVSATKTILTL